MANHAITLNDFEVIDDVNKTIENLITEMYKNNNGLNQDLPFDISFAMPDKDFAPEKLTVNIYLYDIKENTELRSNVPVIERRADGTVHRKRAPIRTKLSYLVTAWSPASEAQQVSQTREEHKLLSRILWILSQHRKIPADLIVGSSLIDLIDEEPPLPTSVILPNGMQNPAEFWSTFEGRPVRPALEYCITFSLDYDRLRESGRMVLTHKSKYGSATRVLRVQIRPYIIPEQPSDHPAATALERMTLSASTAAIDADAAQGDDKITVDDSSDLTADDVLMIVDGQNTEFCKLAQFQNGETELPLVGNLLFAHGSGTELKKLNPNSENIDVKLASVASANSNIIYVSGAGSRNLKIGNILKINNQAKIEYCQITEILGSGIGLDISSDKFMHIGGIVTNEANAPILGAEISLFDSGMTQIEQETSNTEGRFVFRNVEKGRHTFKIEVEGYDPLERTIDDIASAVLDDFIFQLEST